jgi:Ca-activated chloride channel family protein
MNLNRLLPLCGLLAGAWLLPACQQYSTETKLQEAVVETAADPSDLAASPAAETTPENRENYDVIYKNEFLDAQRTPLSTFAIDIDRASHSACRACTTCAL